MSKAKSNQHATGCCAGEVKYRRGTLNFGCDVPTRLSRSPSDLEDPVIASSGGRTCIRFNVTPPTGEKLRGWSISNQWVGIVERMGIRNAGVGIMHCKGCEPPHVYLDSNWARWQSQDWQIWDGWQEALICGREDTYLLNLHSTDGARMCNLRRQQTAGSIGTCMSGYLHIL